MIDQATIDASVRRAQELESDLLPCPFCGSSAHIIEYHGHYHALPSWIIACDGCDVRFDQVSKDPADIVETWNRRAVPLPTNVSHGRGES